MTNLGQGPGVHQEVMVSGGCQGFRGSGGCQGIRGSGGLQEGRGPGGGQEVGAWRWSGQG